MMRLYCTTDTTKHCGGDTKTVCIVLGILVTATKMYSYMFLPAIPAWLLRGTAAILFFVLLLGCVKMLQSLLLAFMLFNLFMKISIYAVVYFLSYTLATYGDHEYFCWPSYQCSLYHLSKGLLWSGLIVAIISYILDVVLTAGVYKLRQLSEGVRTVMC